MLHNFLIFNNIQRVADLIAVPREHKEEAQKNLRNFNYSKPGKLLQDFAYTTWKMQIASSAIAREKTKRIDVIRGYLKSE